MCSPQVGRVINGIATGGLSEAIRPVFHGQNLQSFDNSGYLGPVASFGLPKLQQMQQSQQPNDQYQNQFANQNKPIR